MKIWKIVTVLLAVLLLAGCVGSVSGADISEILITSISAPETAEKPDTTASTTTTGITVDKVEWPGVKDNAFDANKAHTVKVTAKATTSNQFVRNPIAKVNGNSADSVTVSADNKTATITYTFPATKAADKISSIEIKSLDAPITSATPDKSATVDSDEGDDAATISEISWSPTDSPFQMDKAYKVTIKLKTSSKEYVWDSTVSAKIGSISLNTSEVSISGNIVTLTHTYPKTQPLGKISSMNLGVNAPAVGKNPSSSVTTNSNMFTATSSWSPSGAFKPDTSYTTTVTITAKYGYLFDSTISAKVNGADASVLRKSDTEAVVTYTFAQIASVDSVRLNIASPATGEKAQTTVSDATANPIGSAKSATVTWTPSLTNGEFDAGVEYTAAVSIPISGSSSVFDDETLVYINGERALVASISSDSKTITATYTFPKTTFIPNPIEIIKEMFNLMLAIFNPASYVFL